MELHIGLMVRCMAMSTVYPDGKVEPSAHTGRTGTITEHVGKRKLNGKVYDFWRLDIEENHKYSGECLQPIIPDNEAWGSFESMMEDLCLPVP